MAEESPTVEDLIAFFEADLASASPAPSPTIEAAGRVSAEAVHRGAVRLAREVVRRIRERHQFLSVEPADVAAIEGIYTASLHGAAEALRSDAPVRALDDVRLHHRARLEAVLERISARAPHGVGPAVPSSEYAPELQLRVLGFETQPLPEPVLDLGCGREALLVRHLRAEGVAATGLDRDVPPELGIEGDWLDTPLAPAAWGTILSHLGFSLHFLHHHLASRAMAERYARRTMELLRAVRAGGVLAYAPGLPFFEPLLADAGYRIVRIPLPEGIERAMPPELTEHVGADVGYGCQVWTR